MCHFRAMSFDTTNRVLRIWRQLDDKTLILLLYTSFVLAVLIFCLSASIRVHDFDSSFSEVFHSPPSKSCVCRSFHTCINSLDFYPSRHLRNVVVLSLSTRRWNVFSVQPSASRSGFVTKNIYLSTNFMFQN